MANDKQITLKVDTTHEAIQALDSLIDRAHFGIYEALVPNGNEDAACTLRNALIDLSQDLHAALKAGGEL